MEKHYYKQVFEVVKCIPRGKVTSYGAIAEFLELGTPRMVGWALHQCMFDDEVPAHRVVSSKGELIGRNNFITSDWMQNLLEKEGIVIVNSKIVDFHNVFWIPTLTSC
ncbi:MAG: MGMT family protein [Saprospiraceae bacterium]|nr:MGMT family protein [Saprospiraceae bacterium]